MRTIRIDTLVVKGLKQTFVNKSDPLLYGLNLNHLAQIVWLGPINIGTL